MRKKIRLAMPHCMPLVIGESGAPKHTAHASTALGQAAIARASINSPYVRLRFTGN